MTPGACSSRGSHAPTATAAARWGGREPTATPLKLGVVTAFIGVPVFIHFLLRERRLW